MERWLRFSSRLRCNTSDTSGRLTRVPVVDFHGNSVGHISTGSLNPDWGSALADPNGGGEMDGTGRYIVRNKDGKQVGTTGPGGFVKNGDPIPDYPPATFTVVP